MPGAGSRRCRRPSARQDGSEPPIKHLIVAGAGGSIGRRLVETALADRRRVTARARDTASLPAGVRFGSWRLGEPLPRAGLNPDRPRRPKPLSIRHTLGARSDADDCNRSGTRLIGGRGASASVGRCSDHREPRADALHAYGRAKGAIEQVFDASIELSLRVGLVDGGP